MRRDRIVSQNRVVLLHEIANAERCERGENSDRDQDEVDHLVVSKPDTDKQYRDDGANRQNDEAWRERKHQRFHGILRQVVPQLFCGRSLIQLSNNPVHDIRRSGHGYDSGWPRG
jgi:hypothetical protein